MGLLCSLPVNVFFLCPVLVLGLWGSQILCKGLFGHSRGITSTQGWKEGPRWLRARMGSAHSSFGHQSQNISNDKIIKNLKTTSKHQAKQNTKPSMAFVTMGTCVTDYGTSEAA